MIYPISGYNTTKRSHTVFYIGCPMWGYKEWIGNFFPSHTAPGDFLRLYSRRLTTVEGNTSFYAIPSAETVTRWYSEALSLLFQNPTRHQPRTPLRHTQKWDILLYRPYTWIERTLRSIVSTITTSIWTSPTFTTPGFSRLLAWGPAPGSRSASSWLL